MGVVDLQLFRLVWSVSCECKEQSIGIYRHSVNGRDGKSARNKRSYVVVGEAGEEQVVIIEFMVYASIIRGAVLGFIESRSDEARRSIVRRGIHLEIVQADGVNGSNDRGEPGGGPISKVSGVLLFKQGWYG